MQMKATWGTLRVSENTIPPMTGDLEGNMQFKEISINRLQDLLGQKHHFQLKLKRCSV